MNTLDISYTHLQKKLGQKILLEDESFHIRSGNAHMICGVNGAGKTTLLRIMAGLEKPDKSIVSFDSISNHWRKLRKKLYQTSVYLHQSPYMLDSTVKGNLEYVLFHRKIKGIEKKRLINKAVDLAQIQHILYSDARTLSGGEQQRVALARGWLRSPKLMLLDEPATNMDQNSRTRTLALLKSLKAQNMALIIASHDPKQFNNICDHYWLLGDGKLTTSSPDSIKPTTTETI